VRDVGHAELDGAHVGTFALREREDVVCGTRAAKVDLFRASREFGEMPGVCVKGRGQFEIRYADLDASQAGDEALRHVMLRC
jgi:hypothetical protein